MTADPFWSDRFHLCALAAGFLAAVEGRLQDSAYVKRLAYEMYESGAFRDRARPPNSALRLTDAGGGAFCDATNGPPGRASNEGG